MSNILFEVFWIWLYFVLPNTVLNFFLLICCTIFFFVGLGPRKNFHSAKCSTTLSTLQQSLQALQQLQQESNQSLRSMQHHIESIMSQQRRIQSQLSSSHRCDYSLLAALVVVQIFLHWLLWPSISEVQ